MQSKTAQHTSALDEAKRHYKSLSKCLRIALKIAKGETSVDREYVRELFSFDTDEELIEQLDATRDEIESIFLLYSWSFFERRIIEELQQQAHLSNDASDSGFHNKLRELMDEAIERWRIDDILELYKEKTTIESNDVGQIKKIKKHRDYLAHRNPGKINDQPVSLEEVYQLLKRFMSHIEPCENDPSL